MKKAEKVPGFTCGTDVVVSAPRKPRRDSKAKAHTFSFCPLWFGFSLIRRKVVEQIVEIVPFN